MAALVVAIVLLGLLVALGAAMVWQEYRGDTEAVAIYGVEDSIEWVAAGLSPEARAGLRRSDIRRILEWSVQYLQSAAERSDIEEPPVVASTASATYVQERALAAGYAYDGPVILEILDLQAGYLAAIGAVGEPTESGTSPFPPEHPPEADPAHP